VAGPAEAAEVGFADDGFMAQEGRLQHSGEEVGDGHLRRIDQRARENAEDERPTYHQDEGCGYARSWG
jgi:hypothetical protein